MGFRPLRLLRNNARPVNTAQRTRVLQVGKFYHPRQGGMETHLAHLCHGLRHAFDLELLVASETRSGVIELVQGVTIHRAARWFTFAGSPICPNMIRSIREAEPDLVHIHHPNPAAMLAYIASGSRARLVVTYHSDIVRQKFLGKAFDPFLRVVLDRSVAIVATSPAYIPT